MERRVRPTGRQIYGRSQPLSAPNRSRARRPRLSLLQWRLLVLLVLAVAALIGINRLFAVTHVVVSGPAGSADLQPTVQKIVGSSWSLSNLLTLNGAALESKLQQQDPEVRSATVSRRPLHTVVVSVVLKQPSLGWSSGDERFLLDRDGTVIGAFGNATLPVIVDGSNLPVQTGQQVVSTHFVAFVNELLPALAADNVKVNGLSIKDTTLDLTVGTNAGYSLIFDTSRAASDEVQDLKSVQALLAAQKRTPTSYIDLRIAGKAYYR